MHYVVSLSRENWRAQKSRVCVNRKTQDQTLVFVWFKFGSRHFSSGRDSAIWWAPISRMPTCLVFCTERICIIPPCHAHGTLPIPTSKISHRLEFLPMKTCPYSLCRSWNLFTEWPERHSWTAMFGKYTSCLASQSSAWNHTSRAYHCSLSKACLDPHSGLIIPVGVSAEEMG